MEFMDAGVCNFLAVDTLASMLDSHGFKKLDPRDAWSLKPGGKYYTIKNHSALFAFIVGECDASSGFKIISAHSDSPGFRIKPPSRNDERRRCHETEYRGLRRPYTIHVV